MKKLILTTLLLALGAGGAMAQTIRMGTEGAYPPFNFIDDNGQVAGFERELGDDLCKRADLDCTWVTNDWDSIIPNLVSGNYDTIMAGMSINDDRRKVIDFTQAYYPPTDSIFLSADPDVDLKTGVIAAQTGTLQANYISTTGATLLEYATVDQAIAAVKSGEADAVFADKDALMPYTKDGSLQVVGKPVALDEGIAMGLRKSDPELKAKFNDAITAMKKDGSLDKLLVKYFGKDVKQF